MHDTRSKWTRAGLVALVAIALAAPVVAQKKDDKKLKDAERQEVQTLVSAVDHAMSTQAPAGSSAWTVDPSKKEGAVTAAEGAPAIAWRYDTLKAQEGKIYVPFALEFPADSVPGGSTALYLRLTPKGATAPPPTPKEEDKDKDKDQAKDQKSPYPFEDVHFAQPVPAEQSKGQMKVMRAFAVPAGEYDVYVAMMPHTQDSQKKNAPARVVVFKQPVSVPDYWSNELTTSSIIIADKVEGLSAPLAADQQRERPYVLGQTEIVPAVDSEFKKNEELTIIFQVYNPTLENKKPDVTIEYTFFRKEGDGEKPFNKMAPQQFNPQTLPPQFDPEAGFQLAAGWSVPLQSFPEGSYRLEIKVTDNRTKKAITRDVGFTVAGS
jgi:hypothetical protein